jgi:hypothetical protein
LCQRHDGGGHRHDRGCVQPVLQYYDGDAEADGDFEADGDPLADGETDGDTLTDGDFEDDGLPLADGDFDPDGEAVGETLAVGLVLALSDAAAMNAVTQDGDVRVPILTWILPVVRRYHDPRFAMPRPVPLVPLTGAVRPSMRTTPCPN